VTHATVCLHRILGLYHRMPPFDVVSLILAAICHDVGHPGFTNSFMVNTKSQIALVYNDISVLENHHASVTFSTLQKQECNVLEGLSTEDWFTIRKRIIELILATDMKDHYDLISLLRIRKTAADFDIERNGDDAWLLSKLCLKAGDISHAALIWDQHYKWSWCLAEEFQLQGNHEENLGLPKGPLTDSLDKARFAKYQSGFLNFVAMPLFALLDEIDETKKVNSCCVERIKQNDRTWVTTIPDVKNLYRNKEKEQQVVFV